MAAAGITSWFDSLLLHRVANGSDHAVRLAAVLPYVGVDRWYTLARALGLSALVCSYFSVATGLLPRRGPMVALHRQAGLIALALVAAHATVPYLSSLAPYGGWRTGFVPFGQPTSWGIHAAGWESLGILALYLLVLTGPTVYLVAGRTNAWAAIHKAAVLVYALSVAHAFLLGTDFLVSGPPRIALLAAQVPILALLAWRLLPRPAGRGAGAGRGVRWAAVLLTGAGAAIVATLAVLISTGGYAVGIRI